MTSTNTNTNTNTNTTTNNKKDATMTSTSDKKRVVATTPKPEYDWTKDVALFEATSKQIASEKTETKAARKPKEREAKHVEAPVWKESFEDCATQLLETLTKYGQSTLYRLTYLYVSLKLSDYEAAKKAFDSYNTVVDLMTQISKKGGKTEKAAKLLKSGIILADVAKQFGIELHAPVNPGTEEIFTREIFFDAATIELTIGRDSKDVATRKRNFQRVFNEFTRLDGRDLGALNSVAACKSVQTLLDQTILILTVSYNGIMCDLHLPDCLGDLRPTERATVKPIEVKTVLPSGLIKKQ